MKSGKVLLGYKSTLKSLRMGKGASLCYEFCERHQAAYQPLSLWKRSKD